MGLLDTVEPHRGIRSLVQPFPSCGTQASHLTSLGLNYVTCIQGRKHLLCKTVADSIAYEQWLEWHLARAPVAYPPTSPAIHLLSLLLHFSP